MKTKLLLSLVMTLNFSLLFSQVPQGFNYQAVATTDNGILLSNKDIQVIVGILSDTTLPVVVWEELHSSARTNASGAFNLVIGTGTRQSGVASFGNIRWADSPLYLRIKLYYQGVWRTMGSAKLWSVPYSMVAKDLGGSVNKLKVIGTESSTDSALFEVRNKTGQIVFAVYNEGVRIYVDNGVAKGATKGGFAIGGFGTGKGASQPLFIVDTDSIRAYIDTSKVKAVKGGFAIGSFNTSKGILSNLMVMTPKNYFIGHEAGLGNISGLYNSFIGYQAGKSIKDGNYNIFIGYQTGFSTLGPSGAVGGAEGSYNSYVGYQAGYANINGAHNTAFGYSAGHNNISDKNTFLGSLAGYGNTSGYSNTFIGTQTGSRNTTGSFNVFLGRDAGNNIITGNWNTIIGSGAGANIGTGDKNIVIGAGAMGENYFAGSGTGSSNIMIGCQAGYSASNSSSNIFIGNEAGFGETGSNLLIIQNSSSAAPLLYGSFGETKFIRVNGAIEATGTISSVSDISLKENITELTNVTERLDRIRGVNFYFIHPENLGLLLPEGLQIGVIAQEVEKVFPELISTNDKGYKMVDYARLTPVLLEAIKEQNRQIRSQQAELDELKILVNSLASSLAGQSK